MKNITIHAGYLGYSLYLFPSAEAAYICLTATELIDATDVCDAYLLNLKANEKCTLFWHGCEFAFEDDGSHHCINEVSVHLYDEEPMYGWVARSVLPFVNKELSHGTVIVRNDVLVEHDVDLSDIENE
jgi:hypothetical protein